jgi:hypothetical protein
MVELREATSVLVLPMSTILDAPRLERGSEEAAGDEGLTRPMRGLIMSF